MADGVKTQKPDADINRVESTNQVSEGDLDLILESQEKGKELPEPLRPSSDNMMPGLPPIDIKELKLMLSSPRMPSHKILKEVADRLDRQPESDSEDGGSDGGGGKIDGMKGLFDCILEVSLTHNDSDQSDDDDPEDKHIHRELPCSFCGKIFGSSMLLKTHVLVIHSMQDPSVLNIKPVRNMRPSLPLKKRRCSSKSSMIEDKGVKSRSLAADRVQGDENIPMKSGKASPSNRKQSSSLGSEPKSPTNLSRVPVTVASEVVGNEPGADACTALDLSFHLENKEIDSAQGVASDQSINKQSGQTPESSQKSNPCEIAREEMSSPSSSPSKSEISKISVHDTPFERVSNSPSSSSSGQPLGTNPVQDKTSSASKRGPESEDTWVSPAKKSKTTRSRDISDKTSQSTTRRSSRRH